jgi:putative transcriptional regulator
MSLIKPGNLLIAPPAMLDPRFSKSVLLITQHGIEGTQALCINKTMGHGLNEVIGRMGIELPDDPKMYWGGPVGVNTVWMLHETGWLCENTMAVNSNWAMTSSMNMFENVADGDSPADYRVFMGLSSWRPGQLEQELNGTGPFSIESSWLVAEAPSPKELFSQPNRDLWQNCCELAGTQAVSHWLA